MNTIQQHKNNLFKDFLIIALSILIAIILVETNTIGKLLTQTKGLEIISSFIAGIFFSYAFTTAPAVVVLGEIAAANNIFLTAIFGGLGALFSDLIIFTFIKNNLVADIKFLVGKKWRLKIHYILHQKMFRLITVFLGALIIASPFPDEIGIALLGASKIKKSLFIPLSFLFNSAGILIIGLIAKNLT